MSHLLQFGRCQRAWIAVAERVRVSSVWREGLFWMRTGGTGLSLFLILSLGSLRTFASKRPIRWEEVKKFQLG